jgi:hypothetical protein
LTCTIPSEELRAVGARSASRLRNKGRRFLRGRLFSLQGGDFGRPIEQLLSSLQPIGLHQQLSRHIPFGIQLVNHFDRQRTLPVQDLRRARARTNQFSKLRLNAQPLRSDKAACRSDRHAWYPMGLRSFSYFSTSVTRMSSLSPLPFPGSASQAVRFRQSPRRNPLGSELDGFPWPAP